MFAINAANKKSKHTIFSLDTPYTHMHNRTHRTHHIQTINMKNIFSGFGFFSTHFSPFILLAEQKAQRGRKVSSKRIANVSQMMLSMSIFIRKAARVINFATNEICGKSLNGTQPKSYEQKLMPVFQPSWQIHENLNESRCHMPNRSHYRWYRDMGMN